MTNNFSAEQIKMLRAPLDPKVVKHKPTAGSPPYIPGHVAIEAANRIFGFDGWGYAVDRIDRLEAAGGVMYSALVTVTVAGCLPRQDIGTEVASAQKDGKPPSVLAHETAIKGCVTDGIKRALRSFGDQFGQQLYDKDANLGAEYNAWQREQKSEATDDDTEVQEWRASVESYRAADGKVIAAKEKQLGRPVAQWTIAECQKADPVLAERAKKRALEHENDAVEPTSQQEYAEALELARLAVQAVQAKPGGPTLPDQDELRHLLVQLQRLQPHEGETPAAKVSNRDLLSVIASHLPVAAADAAQGTLVGADA